MFFAYQKLTKKQLQKSLKETLLQMEEWFKNNPNRHVCEAELWYGQKHKLNRKSFKEQLKKIADTLETYK